MLPDASLAESLGLQYMYKGTNTGVSDAVYIFWCGIGEELRSAV